MAKLDGQTSKVFLGGFSQGCCLALSTFIRHKHTQGEIGGVLGLSGLFALQVKDWSTEVDITSKKSVPLFLSHGSYDTMIPIDSAKLSYNHLKTNGFDFNFVEEEGLEHSLSLHTIENMKTFLH